MAAVAPDPSPPSLQHGHHSSVPVEAQCEEEHLGHGLVIPVDPRVPVDPVRACRHAFRLHEVAKTGDENAMLLLLLEHASPFDRDDFDNIAVYYSSLNGHLRCCAWLIVAMGGLDKLPSDETLRCTTNALTAEIKHLFQGKTDPKGDL